MAAVFIRSLSLYFCWWLHSFWPNKHGGAPLNLRRILFLIIGMPLFLSLQVIHWLGFLLDEICFRAYRKVKIKDPLFISGIPRSGTTFVHRTLASDRSAFCTVSTWEAVLAPSITERKLLAGLRSIDRMIGNPLLKAANHCLATAAGDFNDIHEIGINAVEEDYLWLLPAGSCFILSMAFPFSEWFNQTATPEKMTAQQRNQLLDFYISCIQRHLFYHGQNRTFLSKNAAFAGWVGPLSKRLPDARFLICVRHPMSALSSQLSSLRSARKLFATDPDGQITKERMTAIFTSSYRDLAELTGSIPSEQMAIIEQSDLRADGVDILNQATDQLSLPSYPVTKKLNNMKKRQSGNPHPHSASDYGLENKEIEVCLMPAYQLILKSKMRITPRISPPIHEHGD